MRHFFFKIFVPIFLKQYGFLHIYVQQTVVLQFMRSPVIRSEVLQWNCANNFWQSKCSFCSRFWKKCPFALDFRPKCFLNLGRSLTIGCFSPLSRSRSLPVASYHTYKEHKGEYSSMSSDKEVFELKVAQIRCSNF